MEIRLARHERDGCVVVRVHGELDITAASLVRDALLDALAWRSPRLVVDLSEVDFLDCAGARALLAASRRARLHEGRMVVAAPSRRVARLLQLTGLGRQFIVCPGVDAAVAVAVAAVTPLARC
jgi:anti-sigma B factor antagonist